MLSPYVAPGIRHGNSPWTILSSSIVTTVCTCLHLTVEEITKKGRTREIVYARQLSMYFLKKRTTLSLKQIGGMFGDRDYTTAIHSINTIKDLMFSDFNIRNEVNKLEGMI